MGDEKPPPPDFTDTTFHAARAAGGCFLFVGFLVPIIVTALAVIDASELSSGNVPALVNAVLWIGFGALALILIKPWGSHDERPLTTRLWIYGNWGWVFGALLAIAGPTFEWTSSAVTDTRTLAGHSASPRSPPRW